MIDNQTAIMIIKKLAEQGGITITKDDIIFLNKHHSQGMYHKERNAEIIEAMAAGFFASASKGEMFIPESDIYSELGKTIQDNNPEASNSFLDFAKTYWSLRVLLNKLNRDNEGYISFIGGRLLGVLEGQIGPVFFPFPGSEQVSHKEREEAQRAILAEYASAIDVEDFFSGNPILIGDRMASSRGSGCLGFFIIGFIAIMASFFSYIVLS